MDMFLVLLITVGVCFGQEDVFQNSSEEETDHDVLGTERPLGSSPLDFYESTTEIKPLLESSIENVRGTDFKNEFNILTADETIQDLLQEKGYQNVLEQILHNGLSHGNHPIICDRLQIRGRWYSPACVRLYALLGCESPYKTYTTKVLKKKSNRRRKINKKHKQTRYQKKNKVLNFPQRETEKEM